jgi:hypothetical protein
VLSNATDLRASLCLAHLVFSASRQAPRNMVNADPKGPGSEGGSLVTKPSMRLPDEESMNESANYAH